MTRKPISLPVKSTSHSSTSSGDGSSDSGSSSSSRIVVTEAEVTGGCSCQRNSSVMLRGVVRIRRPVGMVVHQHHQLAAVGNRYNRCLLHV
jgi:hypothetical protein